jgi:hypothetical protein
MVLNRPWAFFRNKPNHQEQKETMNESKVARVVERVLALKQITEDTTMITGRSQTALLATLNEAELAEAALRIQQGSK